MKKVKIFDLSHVPTHLNYSPLDYATKNINDWLSSFSFDISIFEMSLSNNLCVIIYEENHA
jgi:hypothetical protein